MNIPHPKPLHLKLNTDILYIVLSALCLVCLGLSTYLYLEADRLTHDAKTAPSTMVKTNFYATDDMSEKVQSFALLPAQIPTPHDEYEQHRNRVFVHSGAKLTITRPTGDVSTCTLTVIHPNYGITAGHCVDKGDIVDAVNRENKRYHIGTVIDDLLVGEYDESIPEGSIDAAVVAFNENVIGVTDRVALHLPEVGDTVSVFGQRSKGSQGHVYSLDGVHDTRTPAFLTDALVRGGDSGGPVYDENGRILGIVQYSLGGLSGITPMKTICESERLDTRCDYAASLTLDQTVPSIPK